MAKKKSKSKASAKPALASPSEQSENSEELDIADYENAVREIESIVARLESGEAELGDAIVDYERGIARLKQCHRILDLA
ncbi:MAG: exodeoxyribonuclease VII small subunit [Planctomycetota bacterium]